MCTGQSVLFRRIQLPSLVVSSLGDQSMKFQSKGTSTNRPSERASKHNSTRPCAHGQHIHRVVTFTLIADSFSMAGRTVALLVAVLQAYLIAALNHDRPIDTLRLVPRAPTHGIRSGPFSTPVTDSMDVQALSFIAIGETLRSQTYTLNAAATVANAAADAAVSMQARGPNALRAEVTNWFPMNNVEARPFQHMQLNRFGAYTIRGSRSGPRRFLTPSQRSLMNRRLVCSRGRQHWLVCM